MTRPTTICNERERILFSLTVTTLGSSLVSRLLGRGDQSSRASSWNPGRVRYSGQPQVSDDAKRYRWPIERDDVVLLKHTQAVGIIRRRRRRERLERFEGEEWQMRADPEEHRGLAKSERGSGTNSNSSRRGPRRLAAPSTSSRFSASARRSRVGRSSEAPLVRPIALPAALRSTVPAEGIFGRPTVRRPCGASLG